MRAFSALYRESANPYDLAIIADALIEGSEAHVNHGSKPMPTRFASFEDKSMGRSAMGLLVTTSATLDQT